MKKEKKRNLQKNRQLIKKMRYSSMVSTGKFVDLSDFEETADRSFFLKVGNDAATNAVNENKALRIPITFFLDGWIVRRMPTGDIQRIIEVKSVRTKNRRIAKGTILHVKRSAI
jgi:hypothetical protein